MIAESIVAAANATGGFKVPVVVRLQGTNCHQALELVSMTHTSDSSVLTGLTLSWIETSGLDNVIVDADFESAAQMIVDLVNNME
jgi:succinyl-CoA synthetase beta subunit